MGVDLLRRDLDVAGAVARERRGAPAQAQLEDQRVGRAAPHPHARHVHAALVFELGLRGGAPPLASYRSGDIEIPPGEIASVPHSRRAA